MGVMTHGSASFRRCTGELFSGALLNATILVSSESLEQLRLRQARRVFEAFAFAILPRVGNTAQKDLSTVIAWPDTSQKACLQPTTLPHAIRTSHGISSSRKRPNNVMGYIWLCRINASSATEMVIMPAVRAIPFAHGGRDGRDAQERERWERGLQCAFLTLTQAKARPLL